MRRSETYSLMKNLAMEHANISYVDELSFKDMTDSRIKCVFDLEESVRNIDVLNLNTILKSHLKTPKVLKYNQKDYLWILDALRILLELNSDIIRKPSNLTVGIGT